MNKPQLVFCKHYELPWYNPQQLHINRVLFYPEQGLIFTPRDPFTFKYNNYNKWNTSFIEKIYLYPSIERSYSHIKNFWKEQDVVYLSNLDAYKEVYSSSYSLVGFKPTVKEGIKLTCFNIYLEPLYSY
jgi:hypothetical protein